MRFSPKVFAANAAVSKLAYDLVKDIKPVALIGTADIPRGASAQARCLMTKRPSFTGEAR